MLDCSAKRTEAKYKSVPNITPFIAPHQMIGSLMVLSARPLNIKLFISSEYKRRTFLDETYETKAQKIVMISNVIHINPIAPFSANLALIKRP